MFSTCPHTSMREREGQEKQPRVSGLLSEVSLSMGRFDDDDPGGRVTCRRWVAGVVSLTMEVFLVISQKIYPFLNKFKP